MNGARNLPKERIHSWNQPHPMCISCSHSYYTRLLSFIYLQWICLCNPRKNCGLISTVINIFTHRGGRIVEERWYFFDCSEVELVCVCNDDGKKLIFPTFVFPRPFLNSRWVVSRCVRQLDECLLLGPCSLDTVCTFYRAFCHRIWTSVGARSKWRVFRWLLVVLLTRLHMIWFPFLGPNNTNRKWIVYMVM